MPIASPFPSDTTPAALEFSLLQSWLASSTALQLPLHQIESQQQAKGREVQRLLLQAHLQHRGNGDVGLALLLQHQDGEGLYSYRRLGTRSLTTVFGTVDLVRMGYSRPGVPSIFPLDQALALPARSFSYELQRRLVKAAVQNPFLESVQTIAELTGVSVSKRSLEEILPDAAQDFDAFYRQRSAVPATGSILVAAVDGKGIPMLKPGGAKPSHRLTKGQKANKKRIATVATVFTRAPWVRTPQQVIESLFPTCRRTSGHAPPPPRPENKRVWASLLKGKTAVIQEVAEEMDRRDPSRSLTRLALTDGERALQIRVEGKLNVTLILDLLHVLEKLWKAAYVFHAEGSLEADLWVLDRTLRILFGEVGQVVKGIRQSITKRGLSGASRKTLEGIAGYLYRNRTRMRYDEYLANGWPIASGPVEGACKNLIKDRMERSGMRWTEQMAEAIVQLRAIYLSGDFDHYWEFHIAQDQRRLYPSPWKVVLK
ncbi:MAG: ISKra4 family transposase [Bryobacteraceae bacterium]